MFKAETNTKSLLGPVTPHTVYNVVFTPTVYITDLEIHFNHPERIVHIEISIDDNLISSQRVSMTANTLKISLKEISNCIRSMTYIPPAKYNVALYSDVQHTGKICMPYLS